MGLIGIDSHKDTLACAQVDEAGRLVRFDDIANTTQGHQQFLSWIEREAIDTVAIEGSGNYGRPLAKQLAGVGIAVLEVPPSASNRSMRIQQPIWLTFSS